MLFCYVSIINTVKRGNALSAEGDLTDRQRKIERDVTIVSLYCIQFLINDASAIANKPATKHTRLKLRWQKFKKIKISFIVNI